MAAVPVQVYQHIIRLPLLSHSYVNAAERQSSCLVQPAMGPGGIKQAALVLCCTALQHCQQAGVWQGQQREVCWLLGNI
jgi:hypothetical protein